MSRTWLEVPYSRVPAAPKSPPLLGGSHRMTGADRSIAKRADIVSWLAKCYSEIKAEGPQAWPCFDSQQLGNFLAATGTPVPKAAGLATGRMTAMNPPAAFDAPEGCVKTLSGASFLSHDTGTVCAHIAHRRAAARL